MLTIEASPDGSVTLAGRLDAVQAPQAQAAFDRLGGRVVVDCTALDYISSAGLGVLLKTQNRLLGAGGGLRLVGVSRHIRDIFVYSGFDQILEIEPAA
jgi:anti-sigma B factor antagonist